MFSSKALLNGPFQNGESCLHTACEHGHVEVVKHICEVCDPVMLPGYLSADQVHLNYTLIVNIQGFACMARFSIAMHNIIPCDSQSVS
jgi:hypothetical protein